MTYKPVPKPRPKGPKHLTMDQWHLVLAESKSRGLMEHAMVAVLYECALRAGEIGQIRLDHCSLLHECRFYALRGKGSTSGWMDISLMLANLLSDWIKQRYPDKCLRRPSQFVFPSFRVKGDRTFAGVTRQWVHATIKDICLTVGVPKTAAHPHAIKRSRGQHLFEEAESQGLSLEMMLKIAAERLGHKNAWISFKHYMASAGKGKQLADEVLWKAMGVSERKLMRD